MPIGQYMPTISKKIMYAVVFGNVALWRSSMKLTGLYTVYVDAVMKYNVLWLYSNTFLKADLHSASTKEGSS